ncbi:MAG: hypothetical protein ACXVGR_09305 [Mycobacteriaceae bacterium]
MNAVVRFALAVVGLVVTVALAALVFILGYRFGWAAGIRFAYRPTPYGDNPAIAGFGLLFGLVSGLLAVVALLAVEASVWLGIVAPRLRKRRVSQEAE